MITKGRSSTMRHMSRTHSCAGFEDRTPRTRDTDAHFFSSCAHTTHHQRTCVGSKPDSQGHVDCLPPRTNQKSLIRVMFRGTLLESRFSSFCSTPLPALLNASMRQKPCSTPQGGLILGRLAEQSPLTFLCRQGNFDDSVNELDMSRFQHLRHLLDHGSLSWHHNGSIHDLVDELDSWSFHHLLHLISGHLSSLHNRHIHRIVCELDL